MKGGEALIFCLVFLIACSFFVSADLIENSTFLTENSTSSESEKVVINFNELTAVVFNGFTYEVLLNSLIFSKDTDTLAKISVNGETETFMRGQTKTIGGIDVYLETISRENEKMRSVGIWLINGHKDFCTDSDKKMNIYEKGHTIGFELQATVGYQNVDVWDVCQNENSLYEYGCRDEYFYSETHDCLFGCLDGVCLTSESNNFCEDSDGGNNIYEKGYRIVSNSDYAAYGVKDWDYCIQNPDRSSSGMNIIADGDKKVNSCEGKECYIIEYHCADGLSDAHDGFSCSQGCLDGKCFPLEEPENIPVKKLENFSVEESKIKGCSQGDCYFKEKDKCLVNGQTITFEEENIAVVPVDGSSPKTQATVLRLEPKDISDIFEFSIEKSGVIINSLNSLDKNNEFSLGKISSYYLEEQSAEVILKEVEYNKEDPQSSIIELIIIYENDLQGSFDVEIDKYDLAKDDLDESTTIKVIDENTISIRVETENKPIEFSLEKAQFMKMNVEGEEVELAVKDYDFNKLRPQKGFVEFLVVYENEVGQKRLIRTVSCLDGRLISDSDVKFVGSNYEVYENLGFSEEVIEKNMGSSGSSTTSVNSESSIIGTNSQCNNQCFYDKKCYDFGFRKKDMYCDDRYDEFLPQKEEGEFCDNSFECSSNVCVDSECISSNLIQKIMDWFGRIFG